MLLSVPTILPLVQVLVLGLVLIWADTAGAGAGAGAGACADDGAGAAAGAGAYLRESETRAGGRCGSSASDTFCRRMVNTPS